MLNGFFFTAKPRGGYNYIIVNNPLPLDAVVVVMRDNVVSTAVYVQGGNNYKIEAISTGTSTFYYVLGEDWNHPERQFTRKVEYHRYSSAMSFYERPSGGYIVYSYYTHTLVSGDTDSSYPIMSADSFPSLPK